MKEALAAPREVWFDEYDHKHPVSSLFATAGRLLAHPSRFFEGLDPEGSYLTPTAFYLACYSVFAVLAGFSYTAAFALIEQHPFTLADALSLAVRTLAYVPLLPVVVPFFVAVTHLCVRLFAGERSAGFRATYRALAYASAPDLIAWVPGIGLVVDIVWSVLLATIGLRVVHHTTTRRALLVVVVSAFLGLVGFFALVGLLTFIVAGAAMLVFRR
jgi:hypothetical protein